MKYVFSVLILFVWLLPCDAQSPDYPDTLNKKRLYTTVGIGATGYGAGWSFLSLIWYKDKPRVPFHYYDDSRGYLQMDKAGHAYSAYWLNYASYNALRSTGLSKNKSLLYSGSAALLFMTPIEIFDGMYEGWGFSWYDVIANAAGPAIFATQQALWDQQIMLMKFSYSPSGYPKYHTILGETPVEQFFLDYNGHTYWLSANLKAMTSWDRLPDWLNVAVGYSGNGMIKEFENPEWYRGEPFPHFERYRQYVLSLDIDLSRIKTNRKGVRWLLNTFNMIKIPFPGLEWNRVDGLRFRSLYF